MRAREYTTMLSRRRRFRRTCDYIRTSVCVCVCVCVFLRGNSERLVLLCLKVLRAWNASTRKENATTTRGLIATAPTLSDSKTDWRATHRKRIFPQSPAKFVSQRELSVFYRGVPFTAKDRD